MREPCCSPKLNQENKAPLLPGGARSLSREYGRSFVYLLNTSSSTGARRSVLTRYCDVFVNVAGPPPPHEARRRAFQLGRGMRDE